MITLSSALAIQLIRLGPNQQFGIGARSQALQFVASDPLPDASAGYVLQTTGSGYSYAYSLFLGTWPKQESRIYPAAFAIVNTEAVKVRILKVNFLGLTTDQSHCIFAYLHRDPKKVSNVSASATMGIPATARETLYSGAVSSMTYFNGTNGPEDHSTDGWVLAAGFGYGGGDPPTELNYSVNLGTTRDAGSFDTTRNVWVRDSAETNTNGVASSLTADPSTTASNFVWVDVTVDTRKSTCRQATFSVGSIEIHARSE